MSGKVVKVSGALVIAEGLADVNIGDLVRVGKQGLFGEVLSASRESAAVQVYEDTGGLELGAVVEVTGAPLTIELGPGLLGCVFDGLGRSLPEIRERTGNALVGGVEAATLSRATAWEFVPGVQAGDAVLVGDVIGSVRESAAIVHKIMVPVGVCGVVVSVQEGSFSVDDTICLIRGGNGENFVLTLAQRWSVREGRPVGKRVLPARPLSTGVRVIDTLYPLGKGGTAAVCGSDACGKGDLARRLVLSAEADVVVCVCCGGKGSELAGLLKELRETKNPRGGEALLKRTVVVANTADMPMMACDAAVNTGCAVAEYYRDMGLDVLLVVDSVSRWAEALREISGRLGEAPGDEGYPAYLGRRIARFFERAGAVEGLGSDARRGSLSIVGTVAPAGGDVAEPVAQAVRRIVRAFWEIEVGLYYPAFGLASYSHYADSLAAWFDEKFGAQFLKNRERALELLRREAGLLEVVKIVGRGALSAEDEGSLETARVFREELYGGRREL